MASIPAMQPGTLVHLSYEPGFIVLSYLVSVVGCWTALELLQKRTSARGPYNWYLLIGAATSMGAVSIWSMHYIGNRAISIEQGQQYLQIVYHPAFTVGSFILPILVVVLAFYCLTLHETVTIVGTSIGGFTTGIAVCGMHYLSQGGIDNYQPTFDWRYVLGAAIVAVVAATTALGVFFYFSTSWANAWWKRLSCALLLAVAVSGMHWVATVGTSYRFKRAIQPGQAGLSRTATVAVVICLAIGCCIILMIFAAIAQRSRQRLRDRAQQVTLACATWDPDGRLMVTPEGFLPSRKITDAYMERSFEDVFSIEHPVFCWVFRVSRNWSAVIDLIPSMRDHLRTSDFLKTSRHGSFEKGQESYDQTDDYSRAFKELFCVAANDLASSIQQPLESIGVLYDEILSTGTLKPMKKTRISSRGSNLRLEDEVERANNVGTIGRGQLLFIVRRTSKFQAAQLQAAGYRFAAVSTIIDHLAVGIQVSPQELRPCLDSMRGYSIIPETLEPGVHLTCFAIRPLYQRGFDTLVCKRAKNLLPSIQLPLPNLQRWQTDFISRMDNWTVANCLERLRLASHFPDPEEWQFATQIHDGIINLAKQIDNPFLLEARLTARPLRGPCRASNDTKATGHATILAFRVMTDVHQSRALNEEVEFTPSRFFICQQHVYPNSPDHAIFARRIHQEFAIVNQYKISPADSKKRTSFISSKSILRKSPRQMRTPTTLPAWDLVLPKRDANSHPVRPDNSSESSLMEAQSSTNPFGGIHVLNEISINVCELSSEPEDRSPDVEMRALGVHSEAAVAPIELESFIDELMSLTISERRQQK